MGISHRRWRKIEKSNNDIKASDDLLHSVRRLDTTEAYSTVLGVACILVVVVVCACRSQAAALPLTTYLIGYVEQISFPPEV
jgi:hypothetical protein